MICVQLVIHNLHSAVCRCLRSQVNSNAIYYLVNHAEAVILILNIFKKTEETAQRIGKSST